MNKSRKIIIGAAAGIAVVIAVALRCPERDRNRPVIWEWHRRAW